MSTIKRGRSDTAFARPALDGPPEVRSEPERSPAFGAIVATVAIMVPALLYASRRKRT